LNIFVLKYATALFERLATTVVSLDTWQEIVRVHLNAMLAVALTMWCVTAQTRRRHAVSVAKWVTSEQSAAVHKH
jgi:hypothetical protein